MGAYFQGVLINACHSLVTSSCVGMKLSCAIDVALQQWVVHERSYHVHEDIWEASERENSICADSFTVAAAFHSKRERY